MYPQVSTDPQTATQYDGPMPEDTPSCVAHYGMVRTVFHWSDGDSAEHEGYCRWRNGHVVRALNSKVSP